MSPPKKRNPRRSEGTFTTGGPVTVKRADGIVETLAAYTPDQLERIARASARRPRTWDEINSSKGGGVDRKSGP